MKQFNSLTNKQINHFGQDKTNKFLEEETTRRHTENSRQTYFLPLVEFQSGYS